VDPAAGVPCGALAAEYLRKADKQQLRKDFEALGMQ
jgi:hypothetical protein